MSTPHKISRAAAELGRKGGAAKTDAKREAARKNLKKARKTRWIALYPK
jgi:hypothetical protein